MMQQFYPTPNHSFQYELNKDFHFAAAHYIPHESAGKCREVHGHTYFVNVTIAGNSLDESGFLVNFQQIKSLIHQRFDHTLLNEDFHFSNTNKDRFPTTEIVARTIYELIERDLQTKENEPTCLQVLVRETPTSYVIYRPQRRKNS
ncbi:MAG TPA: 6-carboxytetrahydropterin synthase QueD [Massilibacterium sp.]|nr:6-carboxytetrahydropterin synthase QueD [Massilibacterium sp.]